MRPQKQNNDLLTMICVGSLILNLVTVAFLLVFEMRIQEFKSRVDEGIGRMRSSAANMPRPKMPPVKRD